MGTGLNDRGEPAAPVDQEPERDENAAPEPLSEQERDPSGRYTRVRSEPTLPVCMASDFLPFLPSHRFYGSMPKSLVEVHSRSFTRSVGMSSFRGSELTTSN